MPWHRPYDVTRFAGPENRGQTHLHLVPCPNAARITGKQARVCPTALAEHMP